VQLANQTDELVDKIKRIPGVQGVERDIDRISVRIREEELPCEDLLERLVALGARVRMFQPEAMDMETAFMKLTEGKVA
jgi:ABC-2 type transport system ATP-binding protein